MSWRLAILGRDQGDNDFVSLLKRLERRDRRYPSHSWTEYPYTEVKLVRQMLPDVEIGVYPNSSGEITVFPSQGTTESKLIAGTSLFGLEIISSGETMRANNLREFTETSQTHSPVIIKSPDCPNNGYASELMNKLLENQTLPLL